MDYQLSLVAQFDDLTRNRNVLTEGIEPEFLRFVVNQENCRMQWLAAESGHGGLRDRLNTLEAENNALQTKLKHARGQIDHEMKKRVKAEQETELLERQIVLVRELLTDKQNGTVLNDQDREKLAFLSSDFQTSHNYKASPQKNINLTTIEESASLLSASDISYDKTEEDLDDMSYLRSGRKWKRPSAPPLPKEESPPEKRHRKSQDRKSHERRKKHRRSRSAVVTTTTVTVDNGQVEALQEISTNRERRLSSPDRKLKRFQSTPNVNDSPRVVDSDDEYGYRNSSKTPRTVQDAKNLFKTPSRESTPGMKRYGSHGSSLNRPHVFVSKTVIKPETCVHCKKRINFGKVGLKCNECRISAHPDCKDLVPLPCAPTARTPGKGKGVAATIADYAPDDSPMIPALLIHCVNEVEARGLNEVGIYRVPGAEREVKELKEKFLRGKSTPNLAHINDIHVVCGCLKDFLRGLKEPLVTYQLWNQFVKAAEHRDLDDVKGGLYQAISQLPIPNRDTIAFVILHLQRVSESEGCKMSASNLAKVFGPTVIGYSTAEPEPLQMINETRKQALVMEGLIAISTDYWTTYINVDDDAIHPRDCGTPLTPGDSRSVLTSILGPVHTPHDPDQTREKSRWFTPRFGSKGKQSGKTGKTFFSSPVLR